MTSIAARPTGLYSLLRRPAPELRVQVAYPHRRQFLHALAAAIAGTHGSSAFAQSAQRPADHAAPPFSAFNFFGAPGEPPTLDSAISLAIERVLELTADARPNFRTNHDFDPVFARRKRSDARGLALVNYVLKVPRYHHIGDTLGYASQLASSFNLLSQRVRLLWEFFGASKARIDVDRLIGRFDNEATAIALQRAAGHVMALEERAARGRDNSAAERFGRLVELAHENEPLTSLMKASGYHFDTCESLRLRLDPLLRLSEPDADDYREAAQISAVWDVLESADLKQARAAVADVERRLRIGLAQLRANARFREAPNLRGRGGSDDRRERDSFDEMLREREDEKARTAAREREREREEERDRDRSKTYEPNPLLPPAPTIN